MKLRNKLGKVNQLLCIEYEFQFFIVFFFFLSLLVTPLNIRLLGAHQPLSAGKRYDLLCQSAGSRPPAVITWWRDGQRLEKTTETVNFIRFLYCSYLEQK